MSATEAAALPKPGEKPSSRYFALDGWRAISILMVLASHMLPLGPHAWELNGASGQVGMSLFFTLSGFLITQQLYAKRYIASFFARRLFRIVPLAWAFTLVAALVVGGSVDQGAAHALFVSNYLHEHTMDGLDHFWSLCVEVHFYIGVGLFMALTRFRAFKAIPLFWLAIVLLRLVLAPQGTIETHLRVDEILAGACLALVHLGLFGERPRALLLRTPALLLLLGLLIASHPMTSYFGALRSFFAACLVGHTLFASEAGRYTWLGHRALRYVAEVSYALYVVHPLTYYGWMGSGDVLVRYTKRIGSFVLTFGLAHLSTFYFEHPMTELGRKVAKRLEPHRSSGTQ